MFWEWKSIHIEINPEQAVQQAISIQHTWQNTTNRISYTWNEILKRNKKNLLTRLNPKIRSIGTHP